MAMTTEDTEDRGYGYVYGQIASYSPLNTLKDKTYPNTLKGNTEANKRGL